MTDQERTYMELSDKAFQMAGGGDEVYEVLDHLMRYCRDNPDKSFFESAIAYLRGYLASPRCA